MHLNSSCSLNLNVVKLFSMFRDYILFPRTVVNIFVDFESGSVLKSPIIRKDTLLLSFKIISKLNNSPLS
jgi:hypothetical protein